jgi:hypothetical protein
MRYFALLLALPLCAQVQDQSPAPVRTYKTLLVCGDRNHDVHWSLSEAASDHASCTRAFIAISLGLVPPDCAYPIEHPLERHLVRGSPSFERARFCCWSREEPDLLNNGAASQRQRRLPVNSP